LQVNIVDPLKLTEEFGNILANPVIASHVEATFIVHKGLYVFSLFVFFLIYHPLFNIEGVPDNVDYPVIKWS